MLSVGLGLPRPLGSSYPPGWNKRLSGKEVWFLRWKNRYGELFPLLYLSLPQTAVDEHLFLCLKTIKWTRFVRKLVFIFEGFFETQIPDPVRPSLAQWSGVASCLAAERSWRLASCGLQLALPRGKLRCGTTPHTSSPVSFPSKWRWRKGLSPSLRCSGHPVAQCCCLPPDPTPLPLSCWKTLGWGSTVRRQRAPGVHTGHEVPRNIALRGAADVPFWEWDRGRGLLSLVKEGHHPSQPPLPCAGIPGALAPTSLQ